MTRDRRRWRRRTALGLALLVLALSAPLAGFVVFLRAAAAPPPEPAPPAEGIAVLTGGAERVRTALHLLLADETARLIVSGAHPDATLADLLRRADLPPELAQAVAPRVTLGHAAASTRGNAREIAEWARAGRIGSVRVVTAGYHMPRALLELRRALPEAALLPHPVVPAPLRASAGMPVWRLLAGEYAKLVGAWLGLEHVPADRGRSAGRSCSTSTEFQSGTIRPTARGWPEPALAQPGADVGGILARPAVATQEAPP